MDSKTKRYDRQLRVWGSAGQALLESAQVCLLYSGPTGSEALKNLVLGGIASFTVVDSAVVAAGDLGNNFLVGVEGIGRPRAAVVAEGLREMNDSVSGSFLEESPEALLDRSPAFFKDFNLVLATQMREPHLVKLDAICRAHGVILVVARSYGLAGYLRVSIAEHAVVESRPDDHVPDLRISTPWPELESYARKFDFPNLSDVEHKHVPYVSILLQAVDSWKGTHGGIPPQGSKDRVEFRKVVRSMRRSEDSRGGALEEENFDEAVKALFQVWTRPSIPNEVKAILEEAPSTPSPDSSDFWILVTALKEFMDGEGNGQLPLEGSLPDMTSTTDYYLELQQVYRAKSQKDIMAIEQKVKRMSSSLGREPSAISCDIVQTFCKNAKNLRIIRCPPMFESMQEGSKGHARLSSMMEREDSQSTAALFVLIRAADAFFAKHSRYPGTFTNGEWENDERLLKALVSQQLPWLDTSSPEVDRLALEVCRFGASELHCVGAVLGGIAAQEAIKLLSKQFVPLSGTLVYNGMASTTAVLDV